MYVLYTVGRPVIDPPCVELDLYALSGPPCCRRDRFSLCVKTTQSCFVVKLVMTNIQYPVTLSNKVTIDYLLLTGLELWSNELKSHHQPRPPPSADSLVLFYYASWRGHILVDQGVNYTLRLL